MNCTKTKNFNLVNNTLNGALSIKSRRKRLVDEELAFE